MIYIPVEIDDLGINGFCLKQDTAYLKMGTDAVLLSHFAKPPKRAKVCDLGAGNGAISILMAARYQDIQISAVEIQEGAAKLAQDNAILNNITGKMQVYLEDLCNVNKIFKSENFDLVVSNPPYMANGAGLKSDNEAMRIARMEEKCTIEDVCSAAAYLLRWGGSFNVVYRPERLSVLFNAMTSNSLEPKRLRLVQNKINAVPSLVLVEARKNGNPGIKNLPVLLIRNPDGSFTDEINKIYCRE